MRQGDPISPSLFILAEDVLSCALNNKVLSGDRFSTTIAECPTHLHFANDIIVFSSAKKSAITRLFAILAEYTMASGQMMCNEKCKFFLPSNALASRIRVVKSTTGFERGEFPFIYHGVLIGPGKRSVRHFQHIIERISERTKSWHSKLRSSVGQLVLIKHVLNSIPIHFLSATSIPEACIMKIESILADFFWGSTEYGKRKHWAQWNKLCLPVVEGRLGVRNLRDVR